MTHIFVSMIVKDKKVYTVKCIITYNYIYYVHIYKPYLSGVMTVEVGVLKIFK
jgi:hypothetical protein